MKKHARNEWVIQEWHWAGQPAFVLLAKIVLRLRSPRAYHIISTRRKKKQKLLTFARGIIARNETSSCGQECHWRRKTPYKRIRGYLCSYLNSLGQNGAPTTISISRRTHSLGKWQTDIGMKTSKTFNPAWKKVSTRLTSKGGKTTHMKHIG